MKLLLFKRAYFQVFIMYACMYIIPRLQVHWGPEPIKRHFRARFHKNAPIDKTISSGMKRTCSTMTCGLEAPQICMLYRFTSADKWSVALSQNTMLSTCGLAAPQMRTNFVYRCILVKTGSKMSFGRLWPSMGLEPRDYIHPCIHNKNLGICSFK